MVGLGGPAVRRLGQLSARARVLPRQFKPASASAPWVCRRCVTNAAAEKSQYGHFLPGKPQDLNTSTDPNRTYRAIDTFARRHIGPDDNETQQMLLALDPPVKTLDSFVDEVIPADIRLDKEKEMRIADKEVPKEYQSMYPLSESELLREADKFEKSNRVVESMIGQGYYPSITPAVIQRNVLENPAWYTSYTPYQPEISQGRLESLLNFQTMCSDLTGLPISNASLLDEGTAAAEAMTMSLNMLPRSRQERPGRTLLVSTGLHPQTVRVLEGRADGFGIHIQSVDFTDKKVLDETVQNLGEDLIGMMAQYPDTRGAVNTFDHAAQLARNSGALFSVATDLMALTLLKPPGEFGADIAFGTAQRFGIPLGLGGPHAAFFSVTDRLKRKIPGRLVGMSKDRLGNRAYRLALQTREQHIRREKATSNVCTSQALLANMSALYAIYHGPQGLREIAERIVRGARVIQSAARQMGFDVESDKHSERGVLFDTVVINFKDAENASLFKSFAHENEIEVRSLSPAQIGISVSETTTRAHLTKILSCLEGASKSGSLVPAGDATHDTLRGLLEQHAGPLDIPTEFRRTSDYLTHPVFNTHHSETEILRYIYHLQSKDLSLVHSMIPLGSCTMKLNGTTEMSLISRAGFSNLHPFSAEGNWDGYSMLLRWFSRQLNEITGMEGCSLQPNSGAQGEFAGLRAIKGWHEKNDKPGQKRDICLIPVSAHGTNPASAAMAGMRVVPVKCDVQTGNLDIADLRAKCEKHRNELAAIMVTYPSTYGVFEPGIREVCEVVHEHGGLVYMDGANMNAQIGLCSPGDIGADVCHLNLHKTFCIPHGGGGPGVGPICVKSKLIPHLPNRFNLRSLANGEEVSESPEKGVPVSSARFGSASINLISWAYNTMMGDRGLKQATKITLLNANYLMSRLKEHYPILYTNNAGRCAHEFILDVRGFSKTAGVEAIDIAKRLQDYGFHSPTMSWPVANTLMVEPTESESKQELDRFVDALIAIREEIREVEDGKAPRKGNVLKLAPHPMEDIVMGDGTSGWDRSYSREKAAYPLSWLKEKKFWPSVARIDDTYGDMNLFCTCPPVEDTTGEVD